MAEQFLQQQMLHSFRSLDDERKVQVPGAVEPQHNQETFQIPDAKGWNPYDTLEATSAGATGPSSSWLNWVGHATQAAIEKVRAFGTDLNVTENTVKVYQAVTEIIQPNAWLDGWKHAATSMWSTLTFATEAVEAGASKVILPKENPDGTQNIYGGQTLSAEDVHALHAFRDDSFAFFDNLEEINARIGDEGTLIALMKALADDKQKNYELLKEKLLLAHQDRDRDLKRRLELMKDISEKIKDNRWYDWFFNATSHSTMAFAGIALGAAGGGWFWPVTLMVFAGANMLNTYADHALESTLASATSKASELIFGSQRQKAQKAHLGYFKSAYGMLNILFMMTVGAHQTTGLGQAAMKTVMGLSTIAQNAGQYRKATLHHEQGKVDAEIGDVARKLKDREEAMSSAHQEFAKLHKKQMRLLEQAAQQLERTGQFMRALLRKG